MESNESAVTDLVVSTLEDENDGDFSAGDLSLREAIEIADEGDTITFDSSLNDGTIELTLGELVIDQDLTIQGLGAENITVDGNNNSRVFNVDGGTNDPDINVNIDGLTITGGNAERGGGIYNRENLTLSNSNISGNSASGNGSGLYTILGTTSIDNTVINNNSSSGGTDNNSAVFKRLGSLDITDSVISNNSGSGIYQFEISSGDDGSSNSTPFTVQNSTISGNTDIGIDDGRGTGLITNSTISGNLGGGIDTYRGVTVSNSTITGNSNFGIRNFSNFQLSGRTDLTSSIVAGNASNNDLEDGSFNSGGNNLIGNGDDTGLVNGENGDLVGTADAPIDPQLGELQNNGGATPTVALLDGSPAIDAGSNPNGLATDQRGEGFDRTVGNGTDIGAFEKQTLAITEIVGTSNGDFISSTDPRVRIDGLDGNDTLKSIDGDDTLIGGEGNDSLESGAGLDLLIGGSGNDTLLSGSGNDTLFGRDGNDSLDGGDGEDGLVGEDGRDTLLGGEGNDFLDGGTGVDFLRGDAGDDRLFGGEDNDTLLGSNGDDLLDGGLGIDSLDGGAGNDQLFGQDGNDTLLGGNGNDFLDGGNGNDSLRGDDGDDTFVLSSGSGTDFIVDFGRGNDLLALSSGITFDDLAFAGNDIILGEQTLATLNGFDTATLTESDFVTV